MINDFELMKRQLTELAHIVNAFKSESVQLRIVELIFGDDREQISSGGQETAPPRKKVPSRRTKRPNEGEAAGVNVVEKASREKVRKGRNGGGATEVLRQLATEGFFKSPKLIGEIVEHCRVKLAKSYKPNELSPGLLKLVREKVLDRDTDEKTKQYKYHRK